MHHRQTSGKTIVGAKRLWVGVSAEKQLLNTCYDCEYRKKIIIPTEILFKIFALSVHKAA